MPTKIKAPFLYLWLFLLPLVGWSQQGKKQAVETQEGIPLASMADVGIDSVIINKMDTAIRNGTYPNIHSLLIVRGNQLVYENYWPGNDEKWGQPLGIMIHGKDSLHDLRSISKSIVSACIGCPIGWYIMDQWLTSYAYHIDVGIITLLIAAGVCLLIAVLTVTYHSLKVAMTEPVKTLRYE